jgi:hypothetical protein
MFYVSVPVRCAVSTIKFKLEKFYFVFKESVEQQIL